MRICTNPDCGQRVAETVEVCPACGTALPATQRAVPGYELLGLVRERLGYSVWRARREADGRHVCLRLYHLSGNGDDVLERARAILGKVAAAPAELVVPTLDFRLLDSATALRATPWEEVRSWGDMLGPDRLFRDPRQRRPCLELMQGMARCVAALHEAGHLMPFMTLDDFLLVRDAAGVLQVRLDPKLTRFMPLATDDDGPDAARLRRLHPDLNAERLLDQRSDLWSLGHLFLDLFTGTDQHDDYQALADGIYHRFEPVVLHRKLSALLRQMVEDDPSKRPSSADSVLAALAAVDDADLAKWARFEKDPGRNRRLLNRVLAVAAALVVVAVVLGTVLYHRFSTGIDETRRTTSAAVAKVESLVRDGQGFVDASAKEAVRQALADIRQASPEQRAQAVLARYSRSVAFVQTEGWLEIDGRRLAIASCEGTAFLVTSEGHLLTNRHVVTPWLGESEVADAYAELRRRRLGFRFGVTYRLWFDGDEAFRPLSTGNNSDKAEDKYRLDTAYASGNVHRNVVVAGVMVPPQDVPTALASWMQDDVAVLKIDLLPEGAVPIPLRAGEPPVRGTRVLALGYSSGRDGNADTRALARASEGSVTRVFADAIATDADLHPGNSGGPVLDLDGYVVGIASQLHNRPGGGLQTAMGRLLPIDLANGFLQKVRHDVPVWDGLPPEAFEPEMRTALAAADAGDWATARGLASVPGVAANPEVAQMAAILCYTPDGFTPEGHRLLERLAVLDPEVGFVHLLRYWHDWRAGVPEPDRAARALLLDAPWHSPLEPYGQGVRMLEGTLAPGTAAEQAESAPELANALWIDGTMAQANRDPATAHERFRIALGAIPPEDKLTSYLLRCSLWHAGDHGRQVPAPPSARPQPATGKEMLAAFEGVLLDGSPAAPAANPGTAKFDLLPKVFHAAQRGEWERVRIACDRYLALPHRESANILGVGLLRCQAIGLAGNKAAEAKALAEFRAGIANGWYRQIADCLLGTTDPQEALKSVAGKRPETITLGLALGLRAERDQDREAAINWYNLALDTCQANWLEYELAQERRKAVRSK
ncbi:trypsin-like peptidase domain-containing protein [Oligosphaera ethanolica]|uniref:S1-C subfamily serine protease n=1 Tax=Oligosphaera ethanolica TaxID=760260 RepID=A0AAE3VI33_9BACT|nr:trypsin-like peptidase domain-containing protein [Oligosphaera ethanolica]MDQ0290554.1 S1-C subfamily serine protease [Oligosphaera ethanolica]